MITSIVGAIYRSAAATVNAIVEGFPTPSLPNNSENIDYAVIKDTHQLLAVKAVSVESALVR